MAKKDKADGIPIDFYVPPSSAGGKGPRVPIPINQPNWKYKYSGNTNSKTDHSQWLVIGNLLIVAIAFGVIIITKSYKLPLWIAVITLVVIAFLQIRSAAFRTTNHSDKSKGDEILNPKKKQKKKFSKRRKDYK
jgi:hypothetical protein